MEVTLERFNEVIEGLEKGEIRVAEKKDGQWVVNKWVKEVILAGFKLGAVTDMSQGQFPFFDKATFPVRQFKAEDGVRIVPGGSSIRRGAYLAPGSIVMPPAYVNVGAYVGEGTMVDSHVTIGSCAQVGKHIHISASTQIGGVLEPAGAMPTIIEDGAFIGGNCGIYRRHDRRIHPPQRRRPRGRPPRRRRRLRLQAHHPGRQAPRERRAPLLPRHRQIPRREDLRQRPARRPASLILQISF